MLDDRAPNVKSVKESGETLQLNLEAKERQAIKNQTAQLDKRWSDLNFRAEQRSQTLENIVSIAQEFQEVREPLVGWLDGAEKRFASLEPSTMDADNIEKIIKDLVDLGNEMNLQDEKTKKLALVGKDLQNHCKGKEYCF
ncbi:hypothetical protein DPMN_073946 [Dreissena polymorpha]|uniref:Dystrophin n=1 Tax=Dreissena polymorpha TaxID=45954 RepID=A0A9D4BDM6_DREPO|nr:hypothetical protein DPMN_073946 [Dreissena polymorpha]